MTESQEDQLARTHAREIERYEESCASDKDDEPEECDLCGTTTSHAYHRGLCVICAHDQWADEDPKDEDDE